MIDHSAVQSSTRTLNTILLTDISKIQQQSSYSIWKLYLVILASYVISLIWTSGDICLGLQSPDGRFTCVTSFASVDGNPWTFMLF